MTRRAARRVAALALGLTVAAAAGRAQTLPELREPVNDFAGVIDRESAGRMDTLIRDLQTRTGDVIIVATVSSIAPFPDARSYAVALFENHGRGIGGRSGDNGLLVLLAMQERRVEIEVGYGLEPYITDGFAGETARVVMAPHFRGGEFGPGLLAGVARLAARIAEARGVELTGAPRVREIRRRPSPIGGCALFLLIALVILFSIVQGVVSLLFGSRRRSRWGKRRTWSGWNSGVGPFGGGFGGMGGGFGGFGGGGGGGFGGFGGGRSGGGGGGASW